MRSPESSYTLRKVIDSEILREVLEGTSNLQDDIAGIEACPEIKEVQKHTYNIQII